MNYQAIVRNASGQVLTGGTKVSILFQIHDSSAIGPIVFTENAVEITNQFGLITHFIGSNGNLATVNWGNTEKYLEVLIDVQGGTNYTSMGSTQLLSVPYALFAANSLYGPTGATGPTGPSGGPIGPTGPTGPAGSGGGNVYAVRGMADAIVPRSDVANVVYVDAPEMTITYTPTKNHALVTFSASGDYANVIATNAQWVNTRIVVNGVFTVGQGSSWLVGVNDQGQSANTAWGGSMTIPIPVTIGVSTTIKIQWSYTTGPTGQFNSLNNNVISDPSKASHRSLSVIEY